MRVFILITKVGLWINIQVLHVLKYNMTIEIDDLYRNVKCNMCNKLIERKTKYYYEKSHIVLISLDVCIDCSYRVSLK